MNVKRVLLGGLIAGVFLNVSEGVLNAGILMDDYQAMMEQHGLTEASWAMAGYMLGTLAVGFVLAWLYAATRPRFGPGFKTGAMAGVAVWVLIYALPFVWFGAMGLLLSAGAMTVALVWGLAELIIGGAIAGALYQETGAPTAPEVAAAA